VGTIEVINAHPRRRMAARPVEQVVHMVLRGEHVRGASLTVVFTNGSRSRQLNRDFLGHDVSTDVLSFPLEEHPGLEGEIYVNLDRARSQAREEGVSLWNETARLVVHGTLHLLGYDDRTEREARRMFRRQEEYVLRAGKGRRWR
jgi:probable rRNA maturation factor